VIRWSRVVSLGAVLAASCGGGGAAHGARDRADFPPQPRGCAVQVFQDAPTQTRNIGPVTARCADTDSRDVCLRELEDQVCLLGGDVLWQVEGPTPTATSTGTAQRMRGRASHTR
jgi:hypothetical protein